MIDADNERGELTMKAPQPSLYFVSTPIEQWEIAKVEIALASLLPGVEHELGVFSTKGVSAMANFRSIKASLTRAGKLPQQFELLVDEGVATLKIVISTSAVEEGPLL